MAKLESRLGRLTRGLLTGSVAFFIAGCGVETTDVTNLLNSKNCDPKTDVSQLDLDLASRQKVTVDGIEASVFANDIFLSVPLSAYIWTKTGTNIQEDPIKGLTREIVADNGGNVSVRVEPWFGRRHAIYDFSSKRLPEAEKTTGSKTGDFDSGRRYQLRITSTNCKSK